MTINARARAGTTALAPGITLLQEDPEGEGWTRWRVHASAQVDGKQRRRSWSPVKLGLAAALQEAARYRLAHHPEAAEGVDALLEACWEAISPETLEQLRERAAAVRRAP